MPQTRPVIQRRPASHLPPLPLPSGPAAPAVKAEELTLKAAVDAVIEDATRRLWWKLYGAEHKGLTRERVRSDLWQTPEGRSLADLSRSKWANRPKAEGLRAIAADPKDAARYGEAVRLLAEGLPLP